MSTRRHIANLLLTFGISGLWHGARWTYVCWGLLNGVYLVVGWLTKDWRDRLFSAVGLAQHTSARRAIMLVSTFILTCLAWVIFRTQNLSDAAYVLTHFAMGWDFQEIKTPQFLCGNCRSPSRPFWHWRLDNSGRPGSPFPLS